MEESLHVPAALGTLLLYKRNLKGNNSSDFPSSGGQVTLKFHTFCTIKFYSDYTVNITD